jgi:hypothetical protein
MTVSHPRYIKEEFARRGDEIYESQVRWPLACCRPSHVGESNHGKIVAINQYRNGKKLS